MLGIDPGSRITGYGVIQFSGNQSTHLASGCIKIASGELGERLETIYDGVTAVIAEFGPEELAIERVFVHRNADSALKLGQARGAALLASVRNGLSVSEYAPNQIKKSVVGRGHADKAQMQHMTRVLLGLRTEPTVDAADALAVAICHAHLREHVQRQAQALLDEPRRATSSSRSSHRWTKA
ncbi:MAG: crossover junction endodeoxyribonuclease RuvC [Gammaproteobacteria bacterium]